MRTLMLLFIGIVLPLTLACSNPPPKPLPEEEDARLKQELNDRSFRQFEPSRDSDPRKAVIIEFFDGITLWAQYAEGEYAVKEWEIASQDYRILCHGGSEYEFVLVEPATRQQIPTECEDCIEVSGVSVSIRGLGSGEVSFKINDPEGNLPPPFPVFNRWTNFQEDEYFE